jgi:hypothetical protein
MFRRVAKEPKSRYKHVLWTILALAIGPLVWVVWYCRQRGRGQSAESYDELAELPGTGTATEISHPSAGVSQFYLRKNCHLQSRPEREPKCVA